MEPPKNHAGFLPRRPAGVARAAAALGERRHLGKPEPRRPLFRHWGSGWKCETVGALTLVFNDDGHHILLLSGSERPDVVDAGACYHDRAGFVALYNWARLGDGTHTAVVYDNGVAFARSTFTVATLGMPFVEGAVGECTVEDFPSSGETATFAWNQATQHLELVNEHGGQGSDDDSGSGTDDGESGMDDGGSTGGGGASTGRITLTGDYPQHRSCDIICCAYITNWCDLDGSYWLTGYGIASVPKGVRLPLDQCPAHPDELQVSVPLFPWTKVSHGEPSNNYDDLAQETCRGVLRQIGVQGRPAFGEAGLHGIGTCQYFYQFGGYIPILPGAAVAGAPVTEDLSLVPAEEMPEWTDSVGLLTGGCHNVE